MGLIFGQIKAFKEPAKFLQTAGLGEHVCFSWPGKFVTLQALLPKAKSVAVPVQSFDPIALAVGEDVQSTGKGAQAQFLFNKHAQAVNGFSEVDGFAVQVDLLNGEARVHQQTPWAQRAKAVSHCGSGNVCISRRTPEPIIRVQLVGVG